MEDDYEALRTSLNDRKKKEIIHKPILNNIGESIDFGFQAVNQIQEKVFTFENQNDYQVEWNFESEIFQVNPSFGILEGKGARQTIVISFTPAEASAILNTIILNIDKEEPRIIKVSGIGKYPYIQPQARKVHFNKLLIGKTLTREVIIKNLSQVGTRFTITKLQTDEFKDSSFSCSITDGYIPSQSSFLLNITYKPTVLGLASIAHWKISAPGGNSAEVSAIGEASGFNVRLSEQTINFGEVKIETETSRILTITNDSDLPTKYQFYNDTNNIFRISKPKGVIKANSYVRMLISFVPRHTICYYQRVFCVVQSHKVLYLDLLATCYDLLFKPLPIVQSQIDSFRKRVIEGRLSNIDMKYMENSLLLKLQSNSPLSKRKAAYNQSQQQLTLTNGTDFSVGQFGNYSQLNQTNQQQNQINNSGLYKHQGRSLHVSQSNQQLSVYKQQNQQEKVVNPNNRYSKNNLSPAKSINKNKSLLLTKEKSTQINTSAETQNKTLQQPNLLNNQSSVSLSKQIQQQKGQINTSGTLDTNNPIQNQEQQQQYFDKIPENYEEEQSDLGSQIALHRELFLSQSSGSRLIRTSEENLDFGYQEVMTLSQERVVTIHNNLNCKITIFWTLLKKNSSIDNTLAVFSVQPETASIKPNSRAEFKISFRPIKNSYYFFQDLQFIAYKYSEKLTKNVVDEFQKQLLTQSMKLTKEQFGMSHTQSQQSLRSTVFLNTLNKMDYIADETIPPFSGSVSCIGHSFGPLNQIYIPMVELLPSQNVYFKSCRSGEVAYQSIEVSNEGDTPVYFRVQKDPHGIYSVFPQIGLIQPKQFTLLVIQFTPQETRKYDQQLNIVLNHNNSNVKTINLYGFCSEPIVHFENDGKLFFPPSSLGVYSKQKMKIENRSKINIEYQISIPEKYKEELFFEPSAGIMKSNEYVYINCGFVPYNKKNYKIKPIFKAKEIHDLTQSMIGYFMPGSGNNELQRQQLENEKETLKEIEKQLEVYAKGDDGSIKIKPEILDFGIVKVNFSERLTAQIVNDSNCTFYIELRLVNDDDREETVQEVKQATMPQLVSEVEIDVRRRNRKSIANLDEEETKATPVHDVVAKKKQKQVFDEETIFHNFKLDFTEGIISANSKIDIGLTFSPNQVNLFKLKLEVIATEKNPNASIHRSQNRSFVQKTSLKVVANGNYPLLKIIDVRNDAISVASLWENFQINKINQELATDLNEHEVNFLRIEQLNIEQAQKLQKQLKNYTWNFGYIPNNKTVKPRKIVVTIQNIGGTDLDFDFKLPSDSQIDLEPWADPGELQGEEAYEKAIIDRKIFQIIPKSGTLKPQQLQDIQLIYSPGNIDDSFQILSQKKEKIQTENHLLRVVLQINNGKPLVLNLKGMMLSPNQGMLSVKQNRVSLPDCPIGMLLPIQYPIEIQNVGQTKLNYTIEVQEIDNKGQNIDSKFQIFDISNKNGSLMPNEKQYLYCLFKPLEAKKYYHILSIKATDFMKPLKDIRLHVVGEGFSKIPKRITKSIENEYPQQRSSVSAIGSKVCFSIEEIDFGELQPHQQVHRIIILYNLSNEDRLSFDFTQGFSLQTKAPGLICDDKFLIEPSQGRLSPGEFIELKLTLTASQQPSVYQGEIECAIYWGNHEVGSGNRIVTTMSSVSSHSGLERETLFLRIKKSSKLNNKFQKTEDTLTVQNPKDHLMIQVIGSAIKDILNDEALFDIMKRIDDQPVQLFASFDKEETANITMVSQGLNDMLDISGLADDIMKELRDDIDNNKLNIQEEITFNEQVSFNSVNRSESKNQLNHNNSINNGKPQKQQIFKDYRQLFLTDEFRELTDLIFENTYFNIIQEATRKEVDLLRVGKNFIMSSSQQK